MVHQHSPGSPRWLIEGEGSGEERGRGMEVGRREGGEREGEGGGGRGREVGRREGGGGKWGGERGVRVVGWREGGGGE